MDQLSQSTWNYGESLTSISDSSVGQHVYVTAGTYVVKLEFTSVAKTFGGGVQTYTVLHSRAIDVVVDPASVDALPLAVGLVGHWSFDNCDGSDSSGLARTATVVNATCVAGRRGQALEFRNPGTNTFGGSDWVDLPPHSAAAVTFNAWVKWTGGTGRGGQATALWALGTHTVGPYASIWVNEGTGKVWTDWYTNSPNQLVPGVWTMLTLVSDGQSESLYINGELVNMALRGGQVSFQG